MTFTKWLMQFKKQDNARGDLARDVSQDIHWLADINSWESLRNYLQSRGACSDAIRTAREAWEDYKPDEA